jgi:hypothetical protein
LLFCKSSEAADKVQTDKRKTINGEDILYSMTTLGFDNYAEACKVYLAKYRTVRDLLVRPEVTHLAHGKRSPSHSTSANTYLPVSIREMFLLSSITNQRIARHRRTCKQNQVANEQDRREERQGPPRMTRYRSRSGPKVQPVHEIVPFNSIYPQTIVDDDVLYSPKPNGILSGGQLRE